MNCAPVFPLLSNNWTPDANRALKILMPGPSRRPVNRNW